MIAVQGRLRAVWAVVLVAMLGCSKDVRLGDTVTMPATTTANTTGGTESTVSTTAPTDAGAGSMPPGTDTNAGSTGTVSDDQGASADGHESTGGSEGGPPLPGCDPDRPASIWFLNFYGAELVVGAENAPNDETSNIEMGGSYPAYGDRGDGAKRLAVYGAVREIFAPYNLWITDERPDAPHSMVMIGPAASLEGMAGASVTDCGDAVATNVSFVNASADDGQSLAATAVAIAAHITPALGIERVQGHPEDLNDVDASEFAMLTDACLELAPGALCDVQHAEFCDQGRENPVAEILDRYGACP